jgi:hypothetical protein
MAETHATTNTARLPTKLPNYQITKLPNPQGAPGSRCVLCDANLGFRQSHVPARSIALRNRARLQACRKRTQTTGFSRCGSRPHTHPSRPPLNFPITKLQNYPIPRRALGSRRVLCDANLGLRQSHPRGNRLRNRARLRSRNRARLQACRNNAKATGFSRCGPQTPHDHPSNYPITK